MHWNTDDRVEFARTLRFEMAQAGLYLPERAAISGPVYSGPYSDVFRVEVPSPLALKVCHHPETGVLLPGFARRQFEDLARVHEAMGDDQPYRVPRPVLLIEEQAIVLMEWVGGDTLGQRLRCRGLAPAEVAGAVYQAGAWLRRFHDSGPTSTGLLPAAALYGRLQELLRRHAPGPAEPFVRRALDAIERALPEVGRIDVEKSWLHGDYQVDNLVLAGESVVALDVAYSREDAAAVDVAYFLNSLERFLLQPRGWTLYPFRRRILGAFDRGYSHGEGRPAERTRLDPRVLAWLRMLDLVRSHALLRHSGKTRFHDLYFGRTLEIMLRRMARALASGPGGAEEDGR